MHESVSKDTERDERVLPAGEKKGIVWLHPFERRVDPVHENGNENGYENGRNPNQGACTMISPTHPLRRIFHELVRDCFRDALPHQDGEIAAYVADMLTDFSSTDTLYPVRDAKGVRCMI